MARPTLRSKKPVQSRAKETVRAILEATEILLRTETAETLKLREVVKKAGVATGTFYEYFPSKEVLLRALEERSWARAAERVAEVVEARRDDALDDAIVDIVATAMREMVIAARAHGIDPSSGHIEEVVAYGRRVALVVQGILETRRSEVIDGDLALASRIVVETVAMLIFVGERDHKGAMESGEYPRAVGVMIARFLSKHPRAALAR
ncbi:MAG: helix-turn-helix domain-containing protein [Polyangiaceae bacterium]